MIYLIITYLIIGCSVGEGFLKKETKTPMDTSQTKTSSCTSFRDVWVFESDKKDCVAMGLPGCGDLLKGEFKSYEECISSQ